MSKFYFHGGRKVQVGYIDVQGGYMLFRGVILVFRGVICQTNTVVTLA